MTDMRRVTPDERSQIRELRYGDGLTLDRVAVLTGRSRSTTWRHAPGRPGKVRNDKVRALFATSGLSASGVARRMGWSSGDGADASRVLRALGMRDSVSGHGGRCRRTMIDAETAMLLAEAMGYGGWEALPDDESRGER